jgi:hypothetical protein
MTLREGEFDATEEVGDVVELVGSEDSDWFQEEIAAVVLFVEPGGFEEYRIGSGSDKSFKLSRKLDPLGHWLMWIVSRLRGPLIPCPSRDKAAA